MVVATTRLLIYALNTFMIGLGIYLGIFYTSRINPLPGANGSLAVLIFYLIVICCGLALYYIPHAHWILESVPSDTLTGLIRELRLRVTPRSTSAD